MKEPLTQLAVIRRARGLSQEALSRACGLSQPYISSLELGRRPDDRNHTLRLAAVLEVHPDLLSAPDVRIDITSPSVPTLTTREVKD
jgi:transcriptional regulator with XRE-family HTH domain